jgi:hypothetical protein
MFSEKKEIFIQENNLNQHTKQVFDYLFMQSCHHQLIAGPGISFTVDAPFGANHKLNICRFLYLRQYFGENCTTKMKTTEKGTCYRSTCATASSILSIGTQIR